MTTMIDPRWRAARRVLAIRVDNLGDVLMTTPALAALKGTCQDMHLALLTSPAAAAIAGHASMLDEVIVHDVPWTRGAGDVARPPESDWQLIERLRAGRFDAAVVFTVCTQSALPAALVCRLAGIPLRLAANRENPYELLTDWRPDAEVVATGMRHEVTRQLDLVRSVGFDIEDERLRFVLQDDDRRGAWARLIAAGADATRPMLLVHPGASASSRRWPPERLGAAAQAIAAAAGLQRVVVGSASEAPLIEATATAAGRGTVSVTGGLSLGELAASIADARLLLCNNSGPMHIAAAVGTPILVLYALTNPQHTPWRVPAEVLSRDVSCRHCLQSTCPQPHHACLLGVSIEDVVSAGHRLLERVADAETA